MSRRVTVEEAAALLREADDILLLLHQYPDGDTIGSGYALAMALTALGKRVRPVCSDPIPHKYDFLTEGTEFPVFTPAFICAMDVADTKLLGKLAEQGAAANLCIDHHATNVEYAENLLLDASCGAAAMVVYRVIRALGVPLDRRMAECLYTGLATDTGCFKYPNTTPEAHRIAAELMEEGARYAMINESMFDRKTRARMDLERLALAGMQYHFNGRCAVMVITNRMVEETGAAEDDMEGLAPLPRQIEGVWVGVTLREKADGTFKASIRTGDKVNAADIAAYLGGGGHRGAAGCAVNRPLNEAVARVLEAVAARVDNINA
ncbi:MAG: bifunctional oligoribonuclease/PAP phosphatase NrnA [Ruminococcaceae bacterium]|nr:bifunctional oligoribonuclease/PAP phosphatase NrnA [Oscillospiraceae bacterium]